MTSRLVALSIFVVSSCVLTKTMSAQSEPQGCFSSLSAQYCPATGGASCNTVVYSAQSVASGYTYYWQQRPCCGGTVYLPYYNLGGCLSAELKSPEIRERLFKRAQKEDVLVASCDGYLRLLPHLAMTSAPVPPPASKPTRPSLMGDQIYIPTLGPVSAGLSR